MGLALFSIWILVNANAQAAGERVPASLEGVLVHEVGFRHGGDQLAGSLYLPSGPGPHPAVLMVLGSGVATREYGGVVPALALRFVRSGFACLSWDKPGCGRSTGDFNTQSFDDRADEVLATVRFLRGRSDISPERIGLWGHSQGGMVAPLAASRSDQVAFLIEVSGWQGPAWKQDPVRVETELRTAGFGEADVKRAGDFARRRMDLIRGAGPYDDLYKAQNEVKTLPWFSAVHFCDRVLFESARRCVGYDSTPSWSRVRCPTLVLYGGRDASTGPPEPLIAIIRDGLRIAENADVAVKVFPEADHGLCVARATDARADARQPKIHREATGPNFADGYVETMTDWLSKRFSRAKDPR